MQSQNNLLLPPSSIFISKQKRFKSSINNDTENEFNETVRGPGKYYQELQWK